MSLRIAMFSLVAATVVSGCNKGTVHADEAAPWVELEWVIVTKLSHGKFSTTLPSGEAFKGTYLFVTHDTPEAELQPYHAGWGDGFGSPPEPLASWRGEQEGRVLGLLAGNKSTKMRCVLTPDMPDVGMEGGGEGTCELSTGGVLKARFAVP